MNSFSWGARLEDEYVCVDEADKADMADCDEAVADCRSNPERRVSSFKIDDTNGFHERNTHTVESFESTNVPLIAHIVPTLQHNFGLVSASDYTKFTNFTVGFKDILDYIFVQSSEFDLGSMVCAPMPSEKVLSENTALPSESFPSDHIAIAVDITFR